jgi:hypothetical protein
MNSPEGAFFTRHFLKRERREFSFLCRGTVADHRADRETIKELIRTKSLGERPGAAAVTAP